MPSLGKLILRGGSLLPHNWKRSIQIELQVPHVELTMVNMRRNGFSPNVVIDVGAHRGAWTRICKRIFPSARVLMIEPLVENHNDLERVVAENRGVELAPVLVGPTERVTAPFYQSGVASSVLANAENHTGPTIDLPMTTLDVITKNTPFSRPDLISLDVLGYEVNVLEGGATALSSTEAVLMEVNLTAVKEDAPLFHDTVAFMAKCGFCVYDICKISRRPYDGAIWQMKVMFVKLKSGLVASRRYW